MSNLKSHQCSSLRWSWRRWKQAVKPGAVLMALGMLATTASAQLPTPALFESRFEEGSGNFVTNSGTAGGLGTNDYGLASSASGLPAFTNNVPAGPFAPGGNFYSLNFGTSAGHAPYAGKAVDFPDSVRSATVGLTEFTLSGWINVTDGSIGGGGNRIFTTWPQNVNNVTANRLTGVDLVVESNGRLRLGVNQAPDFPTPPTGPFSSAGRLTISSTANPTNWLFFAVTYNAAQVGSEVTYYFGRPDSVAALDLTASYPRGMVTNCTVPVTLTIGNFMDTPPLLGARDSTSGSRVFRGLMDEIRFFNTALTLEQIQQVQVIGGVVEPIPPGFASEPVNRTVPERQNASFSVTVTGAPPMHLQWQRDSNNIPGANSSTYAIPSVTPSDDGAYFRVMASNAFGVVYSSNALLSVQRDVTPPIVLSVTTARTARNLTNLTVKFSEPVDQGSAEDPANYTLAGGAHITYDAVLQPDLVTVLLTVDPIAPEIPQTLTILGISDRASIPNLLVETNFVFNGPPTSIPPVVHMRLDEGSGTSAANSGTAGGTLNVSTPVPMWTSEVPIGLGSSMSADFGTTTGNYYIESPTNYPQLTGLAKFTLAGWLNCRSSTEGGGGNRVITWINNGGNGVDLVYRSDGSLQMGINQWPDAGGTPSQPRSAAAMIPADPNAGPDNWRFFAVTYDSTLPGEHVKFYFGSNAEDAAMNVALNYPRGAVGSAINRLCIGHFNGATRPNALDRMFRGLIDEVKIFDDALSLSEIIALQRPNGPSSPVGFTLEPVSQTVNEGQPLVFSVVVTGTPPITVQWQRNELDIPGANGLTYSIPSASVDDDNTTYNVVALNPLGIAVTSNALLRVVADLTAPTVIAVTPARSARNLTNITVTFSEPVNAGSAEDPVNYVLDDGALITYSAVLQPNLTTVLLTVDPLTADGSHVLTILGVSDRAGAGNLITETNWPFSGPPSLSPPIVQARFEEASGSTTTNEGTLGGTALFVQQNSFPAFSANVPSGPFAPTDNLASLDFGNIGAGEGARAVDLTTALGPSGTVGALDAFTVCGWVNARDLNEGFGGNRIAFALAAQNGPGFDVVQLNSGALRIGINQWPDAAGGGGPLSSPGRITADPQAGAANWVFFAVTYDSAASGGEIRYYFGTPGQEAQLDIAAPYARGPITTSGKLSVGNFSSVDTGARTGLGPNGPSRVFRGLIDELQVFDDVLTLEQLQQVQLGTTPAPQLSAVREGNQIVISWDSSAGYQLEYRASVVEGTWQAETTAPEINGTHRTVRLPLTESARYYRLAKP